MKKGVVKGLATETGSLDKDAQVLHHLALSAEVFKAERAEGILGSCTALLLCISAVLTAMGLSTADPDCALRFSLCPDVTEEDIDYTVQTIRKHYDMLKAYVRR